jgi:rhodanese-related sulfurtransferase
MNSTQHDSHNDNEGGLVRGMLVIVVLGVALGLTFNTMLLASGPKHGLAWIKQEVKLASFESLAAAAPMDGEGAAIRPDSSADSSKTRRDTTRVDSTHATPAKPGKPVKGSKPGATAKSATAKSAAHAKPGAAKAGASSTPAAAPSKPPAAAPRADAPTVPDTKEPLEAQYGTIKKLWDAGVAVFVDARSPEEYAVGHIPGAVSLPFDDVFKDPEKAKHLDTHGRAIVVTYCGGGDCDLSRNLAFSLIDAGQKKVLVFMGGLPGWKEGGNAVATGKGAGTAP